MLTDERIDIRIIQCKHLRFMQIKSRRAHTARSCYAFTCPRWFYTHNLLIMSHNSKVGDRGSKKKRPIRSLTFRSGAWIQIKNLQVMRCYGKPHPCLVKWYEYRTFTLQDNTSILGTRQRFGRFKDTKGFRPSFETGKVDTLLRQYGDCGKGS